ncbi:MAG: CRISPR-associated protein [Ignavibacteria bacterium]|nr:MAG: CRISPR-associated protein [Ignavibacteria bacterium]KAF0158115.1 MAG: CRISPR-associated protein [Ignavibacteria bacterium]
MIALSFLGTGDYKETTYHDSEIGRSYSSKHFTVVLQKFYEPEKIFLVMTPEAENKHALSLRTECAFVPIPVPSGKSTKEIWEMFSSITNAIPENSELIIDVTHGFRSQPMLALSIALFLRTVKNVNVKKIIYGAFEAKENDIAPIFDITSFINILDWTFAVDNFIKFGNAEQLRDILSVLHKKLKFEHDQNSSLKSFGKLLNDITQSLALIRPSEVSKFSKELPAKINSVKNDISQIPEVKPLDYLLNVIPKSFSDLTFNEDSIFTDAGFRMQGNMIKYYMETNQLVQAITLSREVVVSLVCKTNSFKYLQKEEREKAEDVLYNWAKFLKQGVRLEKTPTEIGKLWQKIIDARNDINHAGMRISSSAASKLNSSINVICKQVIDLINNMFQDKSPSEVEGSKLITHNL